MVPLKITQVEIPPRNTPGRNSGRNKTRNVANKVRVRQPVRFIGIDGEGITLPDGRHEYRMIGIGSKQMVRETGLTTDEILRFLWDNRIPGEKIAYVGFFLGYDFTQWLRGITEHEAKMLFDPVSKEKRRGPGGLPYPVYIGGTLPGAENAVWDIDILGNKRFRFRPGKSYRETGEWMHVCDTGPFFQKAFIKVIDPAAWDEPVCSDEEFALIKAGKERRGGTELTEEDGLYNRLENEVLGRVLNRLQDGFRDLGIYLQPDQWYGPGQAAQAWLKTIGVPTREDLQEKVPHEFFEFGRKSYYGGWFELFAHGYIPGKVWEYDINSAYPYAIARLPCLEHGKFSSGSGTTFDACCLSERDVCIVYAEVSGKSTRIGSMLHRNPDGSIERPRCTVGYFHWKELQAANRAGLIRNIHVLEWVVYHPCDCPPPIAKVADLYALRKKVGKNTPLGIACKLVPNSLYGKFAQSIGFPKYANPVYASLITSSCRTQILDAIATHPNGLRDAVMVATDGIYFRSPHPTLSLSGELGDWEEGIKENITLFKPGVYWDDYTRESIRAGKTVSFKARGVSAKDLQSRLLEIDEAFRHIVVHASKGQEIEWPKVEFPVAFRMTSALLASHRNKWHTAGNVETDAMGVQSANPWLKRCSWYVKDGIIWSKCRPWGTEHESTPYDKTFGMEDLENPHSLLSRSVYGETPEGNPGDIIYDILHRE